MRPFFFHISLFKKTLLVPLLFMGMVFFSSKVSAAVCSISSNTVIDQDYITTNSCSSIEITGSVSTTWIGTTDLQGSGTVTVKSGNVMTVGQSSNMVLGSTDDFVVEANATTTHTAEDPNGLRIQARNVTILGSLSANETGCGRGAAFGGNGYGVDVTTGLCGSGVGGYGRGPGGSGSGGGGGGYAGHGGGGGSSAAGGPAYGNSLYPNYLGSGGGTGFYTGAFGGAGGGLIYVTSTGVLTLDGTIQSNGGAGLYEGSYNGGGGGAGGSIRVAAGTLAGSGSVSVNGGAGAPGGGGGSAGRVVILYDALTTFSLSNIVAQAGLGGVGGSFGNGVDGQSGTTYILSRVIDDGSGTMTVTTGFDFPIEGDYARGAFAFMPGANLQCVDGGSTLTVSSTAWLTLSGVTWTCAASISEITLASSAGISTTNTTLTFSSADFVRVTAPSWTNVTTTFSVTQDGSRADFGIGSNLTLRDFRYTGAIPGSVRSDGGVLAFSDSFGISMVSSTILSSVSSTQLTSLSIDTRSKIDASEKGCFGSVTTSNGFGPNLDTGVCAAGTSGFGHAGNGGGGGGGGGAHAGTGGAAASGGGAQLTTYGSSTLPTMYGSGGGGGYYEASAPGGSGGGRVYLVVSGALTVDGSLLANGGAGVYGGSFNGGGGGSGGSMYLRVSSLAGSGTISADGGSGGSTGGGGGGGGRMAILYSGLSFVGTTSTSAGAGGIGAGSGSEGSMYTLQTNQTPDLPFSLGSTGLVNGGTTSTNTPTFSFTLSDPDLADTDKYQIQIDNTSDFSSPIVDYTSALGAQGARTFQVGQASGGGVYTVGSSGGTLPNGSYYWQVRAVDAAGGTSSYTVARGVGLVGFVVDSDVRTIQFDTTSGSGLESVTATSARITLSASTFENVMVDYAITAGTATGGGTDYTLASGTATITVGDTSTTIPFTIVNDAIAEPGETLTVTLTSPTHAAIGSGSSFTYTILDNDTASITLSRTSLALLEGGDAGTYSVVLGTSPTSVVQVLLNAASGLTLSTTALTFTSLDWSVAQVVSVSPVNDTVRLGDRTLAITQTVSTTAYGYSGMTLDTFSVATTDDESSGSGGTSSFSSGMVVLPPPNPITYQAPIQPVTPFIVAPSTTAIAPSIPVAQTLPNLPSSDGLLTIVNPSDVEQVVIRFNKGVRDLARERQAQTALKREIKASGLAPLSSDALDRLTIFVSYGLTPESAALGTGERRAVLTDAFDTLQSSTVSVTDLERLVHGQIPQARNLAGERRLAVRALATFKTVFGHDPNFKDQKENLAWNVLMYRIRFPRDLEKEKAGIVAFKASFHKAPKDPFQWGAVRMMGYVR